MHVRVEEKPTRTRALSGVLAGAATVGGLVWHFDAPTILVGLVGLAAAGLLFIRPETATLIVVFLLYSNLPVIAHQHHGVPLVLAGSFVLLLAIPAAYWLLLRGERPRTDPVLRLMLCFLAVLLLSALFAQDKGIAAMRIVIFILEGIALYWLIINTVRTRTQLRHVIWTVLATGALLSVLSIYQTISGDHERMFGGLAQRSIRIQELSGGDPRLEPASIRRVSERASGPMDEPNRYAQILIVLLPLAFVPLRHARTRKVRFAAAVVGLTLLVGLALTYSRGAMLALVPMVGMVAAMRWLRPVHLAAALVCLGAVTIQFAPGLVQRAASLGTVTDLIWDRPSVRPDGAIRGRATEMLAATFAFLDHPILGVGPGQYLPLYSMEYHQAVPVKYRDLRRPRRAHNLYVELAAETGILGLAVFTAIIGVLLKNLLRARREWLDRSPEAADMVTAFALGIFAYLVTGMFLHLAYERYLWFLLALAAATLHILHAPERRHA